MEELSSKESCSSRDVLNRSQSCAVFRPSMVDRVTIRKQSDPFIDDTPTANGHLSEPLPLHEAHSYRATTELTGGGAVKRARPVLLETLTEQATASRHSAASLKVHFRSLDDISSDNQVEEEDNDEDDFNLSISEGLSDQSPRRRDHSEGASWSVSGSDLTAQGVDDDDTEEEEVNLAPDGGWGWVIVAASFVVNLIADGATFSFGIVYVELLDYFKKSRGYTAWIGGLFMAIPLLSGPLASSLTDRYGCRTVTIVGSILAALGFVLSSISDSLEVLFLTFGLISGFGLSLCYVAAIVIVAYYFEKRRSLATGLAVCGSGIGTFIFAPLTQYLIAEYGWRGTTLIVAGLFLNISVCGALMRDIEVTGVRQGRKGNNSRGPMSRSGSEYTVQRSRNCSESEPNEVTPNDTTPTAKKVTSSPMFDTNDVTADTRLCNSLVNLPTFLCHGEKIPHEVLMTITNNPRLYSIVLDNYPALFDGYVVTDDDEEERKRVDDGDRPGSRSQMSFKDPNASPLEEAAVMLTVRDGHHYHHHHHQHRNSQQQHQHSSQQNQHYLKGLKVKKRSLTYRGAMLNLPRYRLRASSCPDIYRNSITTIAREKEGACWDYLEELKEVLLDMFDFSYLSNPRFVMFAISNALLYCCYHVPYVYMADWAIAQGHPEEDASFLLSIVGILNTLGEVILGYVGDRSWANPTWIYSACMLLCGLATLSVPLLPTYTWLATASGLFGLSIAANYSLAAVILVDLISLERFVNAYGLLLLFQGVANLVGPPIAGWIRDVTGSYDTSFYIAGVVIILSGAILVMLPAFQHVKLRMSSANGSLEAGMLPKEETKQQTSTKTSCVNAKPTSKANQSKTISTAI